MNPLTSRRTGEVVERTLLVQVVERKKVVERGDNLISPPNINLRKRRNRRNNGNRQNLKNGGNMCRITGVDNIDSYNYLPVKE